MKTIQLTQGQFALVDESDYEPLSVHKWCAAKSGDIYYAMRTILVMGKCKTIFMHRAICPPTEGMIVDHINRNGLDNRRQNLRICTVAQNGWNKIGKKNSATGIKGVNWIAKRKRWQVQVQSNGVKRPLRRFLKLEDAIAHHKAESVLVHGEFARI